MIRTVLVVDDHPDCRLLQRLWLGKLTCRVLESASGEGALGILARESVDVLVTDLRLPGIDGWEVLRRLRASDDRSKPAVVVFSALQPRDWGEFPADVGEYRYLPKPCDGQTFRETIHRALDGVINPRDSTPPGGAVDLRGSCASTCGPRGGVRHVDDVH